MDIERRGRELRFPWYTKTVEKLWQVMKTSLRVLQDQFTLEETTKRRRECGGQREYAKP